jgi:hypothetical protein
MIFNGKELKNDEKMKIYNIRNRNTILVFIQDTQI